MAQNNILEGVPEEFLDLDLMGRVPHRKLPDDTDVPNSFGRKTRGYSPDLPRIDRLDLTAAMIDGTRDRIVMMPCPETLGIDPGASRDDGAHLAELSLGKWHWW